ncbi:MAG: PTS sugar transporter subunit IIA [Waddliaceae bacterium]
MKISDYINPRLIALLDSDSRDQALSQLVQLLDTEGKIKDSAQFLKAITDREQIVSTGIGMGVAIPHAKLSDYNDFFLAIAILNKGVDWQSLDTAPVRLVFMIGGPDDKQMEYLQILSSLTRAIKDEKRRKKLLTAKSAEDIIAIFKDL